MKPILFSEKMVQAILDGNKTMTRRVIKVENPNEWVAENYVRENREYDAEVPCYLYREKSTEDRGIFYPKYDISDILWVRETWTPFCLNKKTCRNSVLTHSDYCYKASPDQCMDVYGCKWKPSIHMPKEAARIFLKVTEVRVERLQSILCGDMKREGCIPKTVTGGQYQQWQRDYWIPLWDSINAERGYPWSSNPWVWVYSFEQCEKPNS